MGKIYLPLERYGISSLEQLDHIGLENYKRLSDFPAVYLFVFKKEVIYIGKTDAMRNRIAVHLRSGKFKPYHKNLKRIDLYWFKFYGREILRIEKTLIRFFFPKLNIQLAKNRGSILKDPKDNGRYTIYIK